MRSLLVILLVVLVGCSPSWEEGPYEVYWIDGTKSLGYKLGNGAFIGRVDFPQEITSNANYLSVSSCQNEFCSYYYIDKAKDHKFAGSGEFVYGPFTKSEFLVLQERLDLPPL